MSERIEPHFGASDGARSVPSGSLRVAQADRAAISIDNDSGGPRPNTGGKWLPVVILALLGAGGVGVALAMRSDRVVQHQDIATAPAPRLAADSPPRSKPPIRDLAYNMCESFEPLVEQALSMRQQGVPISIAKSLADQALSLDPNLWSMLDTSIYMAYHDPDAVITALRNGTWLNGCAAKVRGY